MLENTFSLEPTHTQPLIVDWQKPHTTAASLKLLLTIWNINFFAKNSLFPIPFMLSWENRSFCGIG
jgi:hypothetical protein